MAEIRERHSRNIPALSVLDTYPTALLTFFFGGAMFLILGCRNAHEHMEAFRPGIVNSLCTAVLLVWSILSLSGVSTFLYFNF